jgi:maleate isomerase
LIDGLKALNAKKISLICPYLKPLSKLVVDYIESEGVHVHDYIALEIADNLEVGRHEPDRLLDIYKKIDHSGIDALVVSACVQVRSLSVIERIERQVGVPTVSAAVCTTYQMLTRLGLEPTVPGAGALLSKQYGRRH